VAPRQDALVAIQLDCFFLRQGYGGQVVVPGGRSAGQRSRTHRLKARRNPFWTVFCAAWLPIAGTLAAPPEAWLQIKSLPADFRGLIDITEVDKRSKELAMTREVRDWRKREELSEKRGAEMTDRLISLAKDGDLARLRITVAAWQKQADAPEPSDERRLMRQVLRGVSVTAGESARAQLAQENYEPAIAWLELSAALWPERAQQTYYDLARAHALNGSKKQALAALQQAVVIQ
jgi:tetratricopeptide (TPR) repeat protein